MNKNIHATISSEMRQSSESRTKLFANIEKDFQGRTLVTYFTSFNHPCEIDDDDCDMLQSMLQHMDLSKGLVLMINSPGGNGIAAERIVNTCRSYSGTGDFWAIVPGRAKSAATIICMGASKIYMAAPSELGPIDPQIFRVENGALKVFSAHSLVNGYTKLFESAVKTKGNLEPFIQQLQKYDVRDIKNCQNHIKLSEEIAVKILSTGMLNGKTNKDIRAKMGIFLDPDKGTINHGRPISREEAKGCGLTIENLDVNSASWRRIYELYVRTDMYVSTHASKTIESKAGAFGTPAPAKATK